MGLWILSSVIFGVLVGFVITNGMKRQLNTVSSQTEASDYIREGSMKLTNKNDMFLYRHVTTTPRANTHGTRLGNPRSGGGLYRMGSFRGRGGRMR